jgi:O-antigen/teichoic acid export membrane protein
MAARPPAAILGEVRPASAKRNAAAGALSFLTSVALSLAISPYLVHSLGDHRYGVLSLASEFNGYYGLLDIGVRGALGYYVARSQARRDWGELQSILTTAFWFLWAVAALVAALGIGVAIRFPALFDTGGADPRRVTLTVMVVTLTFALNLPLSIPNAILVGVRRIDLVAFAEIVSKIAGAGFMYAALRSGGGLLEVALGQAGGTVLFWILLYQQLWRLRIRLPVRRPRIEPKAIRELLAVGSATLVMSVALLLVNQVQPIIVASFLGTAWVTYFTIGRYLSVHYYSLVSALSITLTTAFTHHHAAGNRSELTALYLSASRLIGALSAFVGTGVLLFGPRFLALWMGVKYLQGDFRYRSDVVLLLMMAAIFLRGFFCVSSHFLLGCRYLRFLSTLRMVEAAATLVLGLLLIKPLGLAGVAAGSLVPMGVSHLIFLMPYALRRLQLPGRQYFADVIKPSLAVAAATGLPGLVLSAWLPPRSWAAFLTEVLIASACAVAVFWSTAVRSAEREWLLAKLAGRSSGRAAQ